jgi:hypothetical protein
MRRVLFEFFYISAYFRDAVLSDIRSTDKQYDARAGKCFVTGWSIRQGRDFAIVSMQGHHLRGPLSHLSYECRWLFPPG